MSDEHPYGYFAYPETGEPLPDDTPAIVTQWHPNGRDMMVCRDVLFVDPYGGRWRVPMGSVVNGQSIPRFFWRVVGSPFVGKARDASVIHDTLSMRLRISHHVFWWAMRARGNGRINSWLKWAAVYVWNITLRQAR